MLHKKLLFSSILFLNIYTFTSIPTTDQLLLIEHVKNSITQAESEISKLTEEILKLDGMSSNKVRHFLNNICSLPNSNYLEIGVWKGSTFISALYGNKLLNPIAIDNWSEFSGPKNIFLQNVTNFLESNNSTFYECNCFDFDLANIQEKINIYFYDGGHSQEEQRRAFTYFNPIFEDTFIAIVDDYNCEKVKNGTEEAFKELGYKILFEEILPATHNGDKTNWWNGLYVAVISKN